MELVTAGSERNAAGPGVRMRDGGCEPQPCAPRPCDQGRALRFRFPASWVCRERKPGTVHVSTCCKVCYYVPCSSR